MKKYLFCMAAAFIFCIFCAHSDNVTHYHTVKKGETLSSISRKYNVSIASIRALNNIRTSVIYPRQKLIIRNASGLSYKTAGAEWGYETIYYRVKRGDNLWGISRKFNVSISQIKKANKLRSDKLSVGQRLRINVPRTLPAIETPEPIMAVSDKVYHTVKKGETLQGVASRFGVTPEELKRANLLDDRDFKEGQILVIPNLKPEVEDEAAGFSDEKELSMREQIVRDAFSYLGTPYKLGGSGKTSIDCSTLTRVVYGNAGLSLPNTSYLQHREGVYVDLPDAVAGDLIFFKRRGYIGHVGIYIGNNLFIHASQKRRQVTVASLDNSYFKRNFASVRRYIPVDDNVLARRFENALKK